VFTIPFISKVEEGASANVIERSIERKCGHLMYMIENTS
jgi:hypothetical protein